MKKIKLQQYFKIIIFLIFYGCSTAAVEKAAYFYGFNYTAYFLVIIGAILITFFLCYKLITISEKQFKSHKFSMAIFFGSFILFAILIDNFSKPIIKELTIYLDATFYEKRAYEKEKRILNTKIKFEELKLKNEQQNISTLNSIYNKANADKLSFSKTEFDSIINSMTAINSQRLHELNKVKNEIDQSNKISLDKIKKINELYKEKTDVNNELELLTGRDNQIKQRDFWITQIISFLLGVLASIIATYVWEKKIKRTK